MNAHEQRTAVKAVLDVARQRNWPTGQIVAELNSRCGISLLRAHRLASGRTLNEVARAIQQLIIAEGEPAPMLGHHRVSRWETGVERPSPRYMDALCRLYKARPDLLGFGRDYRTMVPESEPAGPEPDPQPAPAPVLQAGVTAAEMVRPGTNEESSDRMKRRETLRALLGITGGGLAGPALRALDLTREHMSNTLQHRSVTETTVDWWEEQAALHGNSYRTKPAIQLLGSAILDFDDIEQLLAYRQSLQSQIRLTTVAAQLAGLIGVLCVDLGEPAQASRWFQVGKLAAEEVQDRGLRAWIRTREALLLLYYAGPADAARAARSARHLASGLPSVAGAMAPAVEARALAMIGRGAEAQTLMEQANRNFDLIPRDVRNGGLFGFPERKFRFYEGNVLARVGSFEATARCHQQALAQYPSHDVVDRAHIALDGAVSLIRRGELIEACRATTRTLLDLPVDTGIGAVVAEADEIRSRCARIGRDHRVLSELGEVIRLRRVGLAANAASPA
ncbi:helix-turn-helix domain-containing protein [Micromonospora sp. WMMD736]|uniref:helix-turn-helix domain-containing protein n=1 Tax=Micromonospora sp. WMMD736 TaxID=3404112 RepID=UPI003B93E37F